MDKSKEYIQMGIKAKELQDFHRFGEGDYFYFSKIGIKVVKSMQGEYLLSDDIHKYPMVDCYWLPNKEQLKEKISKFISDVEYLYSQFCHDRKRTWKYPPPIRYFRTDEQRLLALFMAERYKKFWIKEEWIKDENF